MEGFEPSDWSSFPKYQQDFGLLRHVDIAEAVENHC
jgi:hypothetical protein